MSIVWFIKGKYRINYDFTSLLKNKQQMCVIIDMFDLICIYLKKCTSTSSEERYICPSSRATNVVVFDPGWQGKREEERNTDLFSVTHFPFLFTRRRSPAIMLKAANRTIGLTCAFIFRFFVISSRARSDHPFWRILSSIHKPCTLGY